ncbi:MAG: hypothetical protein ACKO6B_15355, partial [Planctomycetia bacterium]
LSRGAAATLAVGLLCRACLGTAAPADVRRADLITDMPAAGDLATPANGQMLYVLDEARGEVVAIDPFEPQKRRQAVKPRDGDDAGGGPVAIGCIDTSMLALVSRSGDVWSLQTHRIHPDAAADHDKPTQTVMIGKAAAARGPSGDGPPSLAVSPSRDWLGVVGLPAPLPAVLRAPIAGSRIGGLSARSCPGLPAGLRPAVATISPAEEFVLFAADAPAPERAGVFVSFYLPPDPRRLLHLDTSLPRIRDAAFCRTDGTLWVVGGGSEDAPAAQPEGLWRVDAVLRNGRQAANAVCVARLPGARALVCLSEQAIIVTHGREARTVSRIDPTQPASQP